MLKKHAIHILIFTLLTVFLAGCSSTKNGEKPPTQKTKAKPLDIAAASQRVKDADQKVIIFGFDGLTWRKLNSYREKGLMPNFDKVIKNGSSGKLESINPMFSISLWTTMVTGVDFESHGVQYFYKVGRNGIMLPYTSLDRKVKALWNIMNDVGEPSGWVSWWGSWPAEPIKGFNISNYYIADFGFRDVQEMSLFSPPDIADDLKTLKETYTAAWGETEVDKVIGDVSRIKKDKLKSDVWGDFKYGSLNWVYINDKTDFYYNFLRNDYRNDELAVNAGIKEMQKFNPRLTGIYCNGIDGVSHKFWKYDTVDKAIPADVQVSPDDQMMWGKVLSSYYAFNDQLLGKILESIDDKTTIIIVSDHGFDYVAKSNYISLNPLLYELGYVTFKDDLEKIDLAKSKVHEITVKPWEQKRFIRINVRSNDFKDVDGSILGSITPGKEEAEIKQKVIEDLKKLTLKNKGIPVFVEVRKAEPKEINENAGQGDIVAQFNRIIFDSNFEDDIVLPDGRSIPLDLVAIRNYHSGNHDQFDSVIIISGPLAKQGYEIKNARLYDVTPTVLAMLGLPVASNMMTNGKVLSDSLNQEFLQKFPVETVDSYGEFKHAFFGEDVSASTADEEVRKMLQGLGYMQ